MSFCIMLQSNHASSGCSSTNGPRYCSIGLAITELSIASTATSLSMPSFSARSSPSLNATICTCSERLIASFNSSACPLSPMRFTTGPMSSRIGRTRSNASSSPPTMIESFPCSSVDTDPDTGASSITAPGISDGCSTRRARVVC